MKNFDLNLSGVSAANVGPVLKNHIEGIKLADTANWNQAIADVASVFQTHGIENKGREI